MSDKDETGKIHQVDSRGVIRWSERRIGRPVTVGLVDGAPAAILPDAKAVPVNSFVEMRFRASELVNRIRQLAEEYGAVFVLDYTGNFNSATNIEIRIDHCPPKITPEDPKYDRSGWTEEEVVAGLVEAEEHARAVEAERNARIERLKWMTPEEREAAYCARRRELAELYGWNKRRPTVDLSALDHGCATTAYLALMGEDVEITGYDDGAEKAREFAAAGMPVGRVFVPRNRGSVVNSPDGEPLP